MKGRGNTPLHENRIVVDQGGYGTKFTIGNGQYAQDEFFPTGQGSYVYHIYKVTDNETVDIAPTVVGGKVGMTFYARTVEDDEFIVGKMNIDGKDYQGVYCEKMMEYKADRYQLLPLGLKLGYAKYYKVQYQNFNKGDVIYQITKNGKSAFGRDKLLACRFHYPLKGPIWWSIGFYAAAIIACYISAER